jgi:hypothetical protein
MSKNPYNNKKIPIYELVDLPLPTKKNELNILTLDAGSQVLIHARDCMFDCSWVDMLNWITVNGTLEQIEIDRVIILNLMEVEKKNKVDLGKLLRKYVPLEKTNDL